MTPDRRAPRAEDDPVFPARRQAADEAARVARAGAVWRAVGWFCFWEWLGAGIAISSLHAESRSSGLIVLWSGYLLGNTGALASVWFTFLRREWRGDW